MTGRPVSGRRQQILEVLARELETAKNESLDQSSASVEYKSMPD